MYADTDAVKRGEEPESGLKHPLYEEIVLCEEFGPVSFDLTEEVVKSFAFTQDDYSEWSFAKRPSGRPIAHAGALLNPLLQLFTLRYAASEVVGLHVEEEVSFRQPAFVGERVTLRGAYVDKFVRRGEGCVVMEAEATGADGRVLVQHRGVEIMRTVPGQVAGRASAPVSELKRRRVRTDSRTDIAPVQRLMARPERDIGVVPLRKVPTQAQMAVFSRIGDWVTNIHNDLRKARAAGLTVPIVQGQQLFCYATELLTRVFGATWFTTGHLAMKFLRPVQAFDPVEIAGAVRSVDNERVDLDVWVVREDGTVSAVGWAQAALLQEG